MRLLFWAFACACVVTWLIGWVIILVEKMPRRTKLKYYKRIRRAMNVLRNGLWAFLMTTITAGCATTGYAPINTCPPMLRESTYKAMQADERRDYRIAVELCQGVRDDV